MNHSCESDLSVRFDVTYSLTRYHFPLPFSHAEISIIRDDVAIGFRVDSLEHHASRYLDGSRNCRDTPGIIVTSFAAR